MLWWASIHWPGGQRPELVVRQVLTERDGSDEADAEGESDQLDRPLRERRAGCRLGPIVCGSRGGAGRRHVACLDGLDARLHCSPLVPDPAGTPAWATYNAQRHSPVAVRLQFRGFAQQSGCSTNALNIAPHS